MSDRKLAIYNAAVTNADEDPILRGLLTKATDVELMAVSKALRSAYLAGQDDADQRTGKLMARIFGGFVGVTPGIDVEETMTQHPRKRLAGLVKLLSSAAMPKK
jgi:hypothetical protein